MRSSKLKTQAYLKEDIQNDYDSGYTLDTIADRYKKSQQVDFDNKISHKKAYAEICKVIYEYVMARGHI